MVSPTAVVAFSRLAKHPLASFVRRSRRGGSGRYRAWAESDQENFLQEIARNLKRQATFYV
jgi:hypothetical protein